MERARARRKCRLYRSPLRDLVPTISDNVCATAGSACALRTKLREATINDGGDRDRADGGTSADGSKAEKRAAKAR